MNKLIVWARRVGVLTLCFSLLGFGLLGCASSGPATKYYSLFSDKNVTSIDNQLNGIALGVGPVMLADYLDNPSIISTSSSSRVRVAGYHAWAGGLKESMTRVLADNVSSALNIDRVWGFPWDTRVRPEYQIRITVLQFDGERGGDVKFRVKWMLLSQSADKIIATGTEMFSVSTSDESYAGYVQGLNQLTNQFSMVLSERVVEALR